MNSTTPTERGVLHFFRWGTDFQCFSFAKSKTLCGKTWAQVQKENMGKATPPTWDIDEITCPKCQKSPKYKQTIAKQMAERIFRD